MDKQVEASQSDSISTVQVKVNDYEPSVYSEAPPAYKKRRASSVEIARTISFTLIACSLILGGFIFASSYVESQANMCVQQESLGQNSGSSDLRDAPSFQALQVDPLVSDESKQQQAPIQIKMPVQIDFDDLAAALIEKNQKARMNCVIEKRKSEEMTDHQGKTVALPFGVNVTTDPRYEHVTGERMVIFCESGNDDKPEQPNRPAIVPPVPQVVPNQPQFHPLMFEQTERKPFIPPPQRIVLENIERRQPPFVPPFPFEERRFPQPNPFMVEERRFPQANPFMSEERRFSHPQPNPFVVEERRFPQPNPFVPEERKFAQPQQNAIILEERKFPQPNPFVVEERRFPQQAQPGPNAFINEERRFPMPQPAAFMSEERRFPAQLQTAAFMAEERRLPHPNMFMQEERKFQQPQQNAIIVEDRKFPPHHNHFDDRRVPQPQGQPTFIVEERKMPQPQPGAFMDDERRFPQQNTFVIEERKVAPQQNHFVMDERRQFPHANQITVEERKPFEPQIIFEERLPQPQQPPQVIQQKSIFIEERKPQFQPSQPISFEAADRKMPMPQAQGMMMESGERKQGPITIIAREEHIIPVYQREADAPPPAGQARRIHLEPVPLEAQQEKLFKPHQPNLIEGRAFSNTIENLNMIIAEVAAANPQEPSDIVRPPPPPPFQRLPIQIPINRMTQEQRDTLESMNQQPQQVQQEEQNQETSQEEQQQNQEQSSQQEQQQRQNQEPQMQEQSTEQIDNQDEPDSLRPHFVQPRSIRE